MKISSANSSVCAPAWTSGDAAQAALRSAFQYAVEYLESVEGRRVFPDASAVSALDRLPGQLTGYGEPLGRIVSDLGTIAAAATVATAGHRFFGFVNGGALPASVCASVIAAAWDQNAALHVMSPVAAELERVALVWARELLGLPVESDAGLVTGATMASFSGLAAARHYLLERVGWNVEEQGLQGAPEIRVVAGAEVHPSLLKGVAMLGLGRGRVIKVPVDGQGRMRPESLPALDQHTILCLQAGNVNTGAFDPAEPLCEAARRAGAWVHVDGAFGLWAAASPRYRHLTRGFELADSWATDGHKWPNVGYDSGIAVVRHKGALQRAMSLRAAYLKTDAEREPMDYTPDCSRRARGLELWAALRSLGKSGMAALVEGCCDRAREFAEGLEASGFEVLNDVVINQVLVSFGTAERTRAVIRAIQDEGTLWAGPTEWQGRTAMRISVSSWATTARDVEMSLEAIRRVAGGVT